MRMFSRERSCLAVHVSIRCIAGCRADVATVLADVYSSEDFCAGLRAYEAVYGGYRQPDPQLEGRAFEFLGHVKAMTDQHNGSAFCMNQRAFPNAVSSLVRDYNTNPAWRTREPKTVVVEALGRAYPCAASIPVVTRP